MVKHNIEDIYTKYGNTVYKYLVCLTNDMDLSEELTQETFYQAIKGIDKFRGDCKITVWLCQIAKRLWYKELRECKNKTLSIEENKYELSASDDIEKEYCMHLDAVQLFKELHKLNGKAKEVMYLRLTGILSFKEIGEILGESENWARVTFYRVKQKIAKGG